MARIGQQPARPSWWRALSRGTSATGRRPRCGSSRATPTGAESLSRQVIVTPPRRRDVVSVPFQGTSEVERLVVVHAAAHESAGRRDAGNDRRRRPRDRVAGRQARRKPPIQRGPRGSSYRGRPRRRPRPRRRLASRCRRRGRPRRRTAQGPTPSRRSPVRGWPTWQAPARVRGQRENSVLLPRLVLRSRVGVGPDRIHPAEKRRTIGGTSLRLGPPALACAVQPCTVRAPVTAAGTRPRRSAYRCVPARWWPAHPRH